MPTYSLPAGHYIVRPDQRTGVLDFANANGYLPDEPGPPPEQPDPPILVSPLPALNPEQEVFASFDTKPFFFSDDTLTYTSDELPWNGFSLSDGVISGAAVDATSQTVLITATDTFGQSVTASTTINVIAKPVDPPIPPPVPGQERHVGGPNARVVMNSSAIKRVLYWTPEEPNRSDWASGTQMLWQVRSAGGFHQGLGYFYAPDREGLAYRTKWLVEQKRPGVIFFPHGDVTVIKPKDPGAYSFGYSIYQYTWASAGNLSKAIPHDTNNKPFSQKTTPSQPNRSMYGGLHPDAVAHYVNTRVATLYRSGAENLQGLWPCVMSDAMSVSNRKGGSPVLQDGTITSVSGKRLAMPLYNFPNSGTADPDNSGFTMINGTYFVQANPPGYGSSYECRTARSFRDDGGGAMTVHFKDTVPGAISAGWFGRVYFAGNVTKCAKWPQADNPTQYTGLVCPNLRGDHNDDSNEIKHRVAAFKRFFDAQDAYTKSQTGLEYGVLCNSVAGTHLDKRVSGMSANHAWMGKCNFVHCEHLNEGRSSTQGFYYDKKDDDNYFYAITKDTDVDFTLSKFPLGTSHLARPATGDFGKSYVGGTLTLGDSNRLSAVDNVSLTGHAYASFYETLIIMGSGDNFRININNTSGTAYQYNTGRMIVSFPDYPVKPETAFDASPVEDNTDDWLADPTDPYAQRWGLHRSYDPSGNNDKGTLVFRPSDWGGKAYQWEMWWKLPNGDVLITILNMRKVGSTVTSWAPHDIGLAEGRDTPFRTIALDDENPAQPVTADDVYTVHDIPAGKAVYSLDLVDYEDWESGESLYQGVYAAVNGRATNVGFYTPKYPHVANGRPGIGELIGGNGATFTVGPGEDRWVIISDG